jgi:hypothetical protein
VEIMSVRALAVGTAVVSLAVLALGPAALGVDPDHRAAEAQARSKVVDQTMTCKTVLQAGIRKLTVWATSTVAAQRDFQGRKIHPAARLSTGSMDGPTLVSAGTGPARRESGPYFVLNPKQCKASSRTVPLSPRGLSGGRASPLGEEFECFPGRGVLLRVRAVFRTPTRMRRGGDGQLVTEAGLRQVSFAARTLAGRPVVYVTASDSGKAELFVAPGCVRD